MDDDKLLAQLPAPVRRLRQDGAVRRGARRRGDDAPQHARMRRADTFAAFFEEDFDATQFASELIVHDSAAASAMGGPGADADVPTASLRKSSVELLLQSLAAHLASMDRAIQSIVTTQYEPLVARAGQTQAVRQEVVEVEGQLLDLKLSASRLRQDVLEPCGRLRARVEEAERVQQASDTLRSLQRLFAACKRLASFVPLAGAGAAAAATASASAAPPAPIPQRDLPAVARSVREAEQLLAQCDLTGIAAADARLPLVQAAGRAVRQQARALLTDGLARSDQAALAAALQAARELSCLGDWVVAAVAELVAGVGSSAAQALDVDAGDEVRSPGTSARRAAGQAQVWQRLDEAAGAVYRAALQAHLLAGVLARWRDPRTMQSLAEEVRASVRVVRRRPHARGRRRRRCARRARRRAA